MPRNPDNPLAPKATRQMPEPTLRRVFEDYKNIRKIKKETITAYEEVLNRCLPDWWDRNLNHIGKEEILTRHFELTNRNSAKGKGDRQANLAFKILGAIFRYAQGRYEDENHNPIVRNRPTDVLTACRAWNKSRRRTSFIQKHQMKDWFAAILRYPNSSVRDYFIFIYLTGCRRTEAAYLQWQWVDLKNGFITFPGEAVKNGTDFKLPLSRYLWHMLRQRKSSPSCDPIWVFDGARRGKPLSNQLKCPSILFRETGFTWMIHDLRRTYTTIAHSCLPGDLITLKRLINHTVASNDVTAGYICYDPDNLRVFADLIADKILEYSGFRFIDNVGLAPVDCSSSVEARITEEALLSALSKLDPEKLKPLETATRQRHLSLVGSKNGYAGSR